MRYRFIYGRDSEPEVKAEVLTHEQREAMDILDSSPLGTDMQILYKEVHLRNSGSYRRWRIKAEINVLIRRRMGIECTYVDFLNEDFELDDLSAEIEAMNESKKRVEASSQKLKAMMRKAKLGLK